MAIFRKIYFFVFLFSIFFTINSYSEVVNKVEVQGNQRISLETIIIFGDIIQGKNYEREDISLLIKKLYETSFFSNNLVLFFIKEVKTNPEIRVININIFFIKDYPTPQSEDSFEIFLLIPRGKNIFYYFLFHSVILQILMKD